MELAAVKEYLDEHYTEKLTLDDLAEKVLHQQVLSVQNLQRDLRNDGQQLSDLKADHQSQAAASLHRYDCRRSRRCGRHGRRKLLQPDVPQGGRN